MNLKNKIIGFLQIIVISSVLIIGGKFLYTKYMPESAEVLSVNDEKLSLRYLPKDFQYQPDPQFVLAVLTNPVRYKREFDQLVYEINMAILQHVFSRLGLFDQYADLIKSQYKHHHIYLTELYYNDFTTHFDSTAALQEMWYASRGKNAVEALNQVASSYTCFLITQVLNSLIGYTGEEILVAGKELAKPCSIALDEAFKPLIKGLKSRAAIEDFQKSKGIFEKKIEASISELATYEVRDKKGLTRQMQTKVFGYAVSNTNIEVSAISIIKAGIQLNAGVLLNIDDSKGEVIITLPPPSILSHEVYPRIDQMNLGWMRELTSADLNENFELLRQEFRKEAIADNLFDKAKKQVESLMLSLYEPVIKNFNSSYKLVVRFSQPKENDKFNPLVD